MNYQATTSALRIAVEAGLPVALRGRPGVGKTSMAETVARELGLHLEVVVGSLREPTDLAGLPVVSTDGTVRLAAPAWAQRAADAEGGALVLLDELTTASPAVQAAMLRVIRERVVGELSMGPNVRIVGAYNDARDCGGFELELPMRSRLLHLSVGADLDSFVDGLVNGWSSPVVGGPATGRATRGANSRLVAGFLRARPSLLEDVPQHSSTGGYPCPRTWEMAVDALTAADSSGLVDEVRYVLVAGCIGSGAASEFLAWCDALDLPDPREILRSPALLAQHLSTKRPDRSYVVLSSVVDCAGASVDAATWSALVDVLASTVKAGYGDLVGVHARRVVAMRPAKTPLPASFSLVAGMVGAL